MALNNVILAATISLLGNTVHSQFLGWLDSDKANTNFSSPITFSEQDATILVQEEKNFKVLVK